MPDRPHSPSSIFRHDDAWVPPQTHNHTITAAPQHSSRSALALRRGVTPACPSEFRRAVGVKLSVIALRIDDLIEPLGDVGDQA